MKKHKLVTIGILSAVVMMAATACSSKTTETTAAPTTTAEETTAATTEETTTALDGSSEEDESTVEESEESTPAPTDAGVADASGKFKAANGKYEITIPEGWTIDGSSDESFATFISADGSSYIEVEYQTGDIEGLVEELPDSMEEYKSWVIRDEDADFVNYNVENTANGQNYQYAIKYNSADADPKYMSINCSYDTKAKQYLSATAVVEADSADAIKAVDEAMKSFKMIK